MDKNRLDNIIIDYSLSHKTNITANAIPTVKNPIIKPSIPSLQRGEHQSFVRPSVVSELKEKKVYFIISSSSNLFIILAFDALLLIIVVFIGLANELFVDCCVFALEYALFGDH